MHGSGRAYQKWLYCKCLNTIAKPRVEKKKGILYTGMSFLRILVPLHAASFREPPALATCALVGSLELRGGFPFTPLQEQGIQIPNHQSKPPMKGNLKFGNRSPQFETKTDACGPDSTGRSENGSFVGVQRSQPPQVSVP